MNEGKILYNRLDNSGVILDTLLSLQLLLGTLETYLNILDMSDKDKDASKIAQTVIHISKAKNIIQEMNMELE